MKRITRKIVGYDILFDKNHETIQKIINSSPKSKTILFDDYNDYFNINYHGGKYKSLNSKSQTYNIGVKGVNSDFRKYIPFLQQKSKCFARSLEMY